MVALRLMPAVRLTEPKCRIFVRSTASSSTSSGQMSRSAPRRKRKLRSPVSSTATTAMVVGWLPT